MLHQRQVISCICTLKLFSLKIHSLDLTKLSFSFFHREDFNIPTPPFAKENKSKKTPKPQNSAETLEKGEELDVTEA